MDGDEVTSLTVESVGQSAVDQSALETVPLKYLREVARGVLRGIDEDLEGGGSVGAALEVSSIPRGFVEVKHAPPPPELFASYWLSIPEASTVDGMKLTRREQARRRWNVTVYAIDKWLREARDLGLIPERTTKPRSTDGLGGLSVP